jgi:hypothetical protein
VSVYADSSFLFSAFGADEHTQRAGRWLRGCTEFPILVSRLTLFETENAYRAAVLDERMSAADMRAALKRITHALHEGFLLRREVSPHQWFPQAHRISGHDTHQSAARALDILHIAAAIVLRAKGFLSFDGRQRELAKAEGLKVMP